MPLAQAVSGNSPSRAVPLTVRQSPERANTGVEMAKTKDQDVAAPADNLKDPHYTPPMAEAIPLGLQHVCAMLVGNIAVPFIVGSAMGLSLPDRIFLVQAAMLMAGIATLLQTIGIGPVGARLPVMQGTSFAFIGPLIAIGKAGGMAAIFGAAILNGIFQMILAFFLKYVKQYIPPLVSGLVVLTIGATLLNVAINYAGGHPVPKVLGAEFGSFKYIGLAGLVVIIALFFRSYFAGFMGAAGIIIALVVGYVIALPMGMVKTANIANAAWFGVPDPLHFGTPVIGLSMIFIMVLMAFVTTIETIGDISGTTVTGADRQPTEQELRGGILADGLGTLVAALGNAMPNTSYSQNVGVISYTGVMSRHVVTIGGVFLILAGIVPKFGAIITAMPYAVFGGAGIVMFGLVLAAGIKLIAQEKMTRRNLLIIAVSLATGLGIYSVPQFYQHMPADLQLMFKAPIIPVAVISFVLNIVMPEDEVSAEA
jgi:NCS2 family nucleobase:cation symporter-2